MASQREIWQPSSFRISPLKNAKTTRTRAGATVRCWDIRGRTDGRQWFRRVTAPHTRDTVLEMIRQMEADYLAGKAWDHTNKQFVEVNRYEATVLYLAVSHWARNAPDWSPRTREWAARALTHLVCYLQHRPEKATPEKARQLFTSDGSPPPPSETLDRVTAGSLTASDVTVQDLERCLDDYRGTGDNQIAPATERRYLAVVRAMFTAAVRLGDLPPPSPADAVIARRTRRRSGVVSSLDTKQIERSSVLSIEQVFALADAAEERTGRSDDAVFVLLMGLCGLRPSEATALRVGDIDGQWVTVRASSVQGERHWRTEDDPAVDNPLKGRASSRSRRAPVPESIRDRVAQHVETLDPGRLVVTGPRGGRVNLGSHGRSVWAPVREQLFAGTVHAQIRRHDLRHTACTTWLNANVPPKVAMTWAGHRSLAVFLDIYQGLVDGAEEQAASLLDSHINRHGL